jgi:hypothetical protein
MIPRSGMRQPSPGLPRLKIVPNKKADHILPLIELLGKGKFTARSVKKSAKHHPGVPFRAMVDDATTLATELRETIQAIADTTDDRDPKMQVLERILAALG